MVITAGWVAKWHNIYSMKDSTKRLLGLLLVLTTSAWSQAVCPMMLFPQLSPSCGTHHATAAVTAESMGSEHPCCPRKHASHITHEQSSTANLSNVNRMDCCSVERPPATSSKMVQSSPDIAVIGRVIVSEGDVPRSQRWIETADSGPPLRGVLSLKEDLRI
jgi:hypothetical protein